MYGVGVDTGAGTTWAVAVHDLAARRTELVAESADVVPMYAAASDGACLISYTGARQTRRWRPRRCTPSRGSASTAQRTAACR